MSIDTYRIALLENGCEPPEPVFETGRRREAAAWAKEWLKEPLGFAVVIYPPYVPMPVASEPEQAEVVGLA